MKPLAPTRCVAALAAVALAACSQHPEPGQATPASTATSALTTSTPVISAPAQAGTAGLPGDHATARHYKIAIEVPALPAGTKPLADALRATADDAKREFLQALPDPKQLPEFANRRFELLLDFKVAALTPAFVSVRETGMQDTGGAHPMPVEAAFVYDRKAGRLVTLDDLFADPDSARGALADFAHAALLEKFMADAPKRGAGSPAAIREWKSNMLQMLDGGTKPTTLNYSVFVVRAGGVGNAASPGLTLIFPPYQVAAYVYGTQTVDVPASVFAKFLKPDYASTFRP